MKTFRLVILFLVIQYSTYCQKTYPKLNIEEHKEKFYTDSLSKFDLSLFKINFDDLHELNLTEYYTFLQKELHYSSVDANPYYLFSIQSISEIYSSVTILHYKEALFTDLVLITYDAEGRKISETAVAVEGGDGAWWFKETSQFINDSILKAKYIESELIEEQDTLEIWQTKNINTTYILNKIGQINTISIDSTITKEKHNYR